MHCFGATYQSSSFSQLNMMYDDSIHSLLSVELQCCYVLCSMNTLSLLYLNAQRLMHILLFIYIFIYILCIHIYHTDMIHCTLDMHAWVCAYTFWSLCCISLICFVNTMFWNVLSRNRNLCWNYWMLVFQIWHSEKNITDTIFIYFLEIPIIVPW